LAPHGREFVRLPWTTPQPIPEALRAIVNRSTAGQLRLRYRHARTFRGAMAGRPPVAHLPPLPELGPRVQRVTAIESQRTDEIAAHLLPDLALSFELLRTINTGQVEGTQIAGTAPGVA